MRGPGLRVQTDVRRSWRCPACGQERRIPATIVSVVCPCQTPNLQMRLVEPMRKVRPEPIPLPPYFEPEDFLSEPESTGNPNEAATFPTCVENLQEPPSEVPLSGQDVSPIDAVEIEDVSVPTEPTSRRSGPGDLPPDPSPSGENDAVL